MRGWVLAFDVRGEALVIDFRDPVIRECPMSSALRLLGFSASHKHLKMAWSGYGKRLSRPRSPTARSSQTLSQQQTVAARARRSLAWFRVFRGGCHGIQGGARRFTG